ncbi:hypothetical protein HY383_04470 [Candidatus Daviesbacteria bacterium]|nr:hypothetical protein [Candidatus Daviesbacteria bacterium]
MSDGTPKEPDIADHEGTLSKAFGKGWMNQYKTDYRELSKNPSATAPAANTSEKPAQPAPKQPFWKKIIPSRSSA